MSKLTITNSDFKSTLEDRIESGQKLIEKITSENFDFEILNREMSRWSCKLPLKPNCLKVE